VWTVRGNGAQIAAWLASVSATTCAAARRWWTNDYKGLTDTCGQTGSASVKFTATDACGNQSSCTRTVTIVDTASAGDYLHHECGLRV